MDSRRPAAGAYRYALLAPGAPAGMTAAMPLGRGLEIAPRAGDVNPYKYGIVGTADQTKALPDPATIQERGWSSPIGYTPTTQPSASIRPRIGDLPRAPDFFAINFHAPRGAYPQPDLMGIDLHDGDCNLLADEQ